MGFKLLRNNDAKIVRGWPVTIQEPLDGGKTAQHKVEVDYEILSESEKDKVIEGGGNAAFLQRVINGWKYFKDGDGNELECNESNKELALDMSYVVTALLSGYFQAAAGGRRKN